MQLALQLLDPLGADEERAAVHAGPQRAERDRVRDAIDGQVVGALEAPDCVGRDRPVAPVDQSGFEAERGELVLEFLDAFLAVRERLLGGLLSVQRVQRRLVGDPVVGEVLGALEPLDCFGRPWPVASVVGSGFEPLFGELALELLDALDASGERPVGRAGPQRGQRGGVSDAVGRQPADLLEAADRFGGLGAVAPVNEARVKPQPGQLALQRLDPLDPFLGRFWFIDRPMGLALSTVPLLPAFAGDPADGIATAASSAAICAAELVGSCDAAETDSGVARVGARAGAGAGAGRGSGRAVGRLVDLRSRGLRRGMRRPGLRPRSANTASATIASAPSSSRIVHGKLEGLWTTGWAGAGAGWCSWVCRLALGCAVPPGCSGDGAGCKAGLRV